MTVSFPLETERLIIRHFVNSDLESFLSYRNNPEVARHQGWNVPYPREKGLELITEMKDSLFEMEPGRWFQVALELKSSGDMIGDIAFHIKKDDHRQAYVGYTLARRFWRQGFAAEAVCRLLDYLFSELDLHRIIAEVDVENVPSWRMLEKLGFRREAHFVENVWLKGEYASEYHYAMLKREWDERKTPR